MRIPDERQMLIDEFGALAEKLRGHKRLEKRYDQLRTRILAPYSERDPEETIYEDGGRYGIQIGPNAMQRTIVNIEGLYKHLGKQQFFRLAKIPLEELDRVILPRDLEGLLSTGRTGPRTVLAVERFTDAAG